MKAVLMGKNVVRSIVLPKEVRGQYKIEEQNAGKYEKKEISVEADSNGWIIKKSEQILVEDLLTGESNKEEAIVLKASHVYSVLFSDYSEKSILFIEPENKGNQNFVQYAIPDEEIIIIGTDKESHIVYDNPFLSGKLKVCITYKDGEIIVRDEMSGHPEKCGNIYLNDKYMENAVASYGDVLYLFGLKIIIGKSFISINQPSNLKEVKLNRFVFQGKNGKTNFVNIDSSCFSSSPKKERKIKVEKIIVEKPPHPSSGDETPLYLTVGPALTMATASAVTGAYSVMNTLQNHGDLMQIMPTLVMIGAVMLGSLVWPVFSKRYQKRKNLRQDAENYERYVEHIAEKRLQVENLKKTQKEKLVANYPTLVQCENRILGRESSLWERSIGESDFLELNLGKGTDQLYCEIQYPSEDIFEAPAKITELLKEFKAEEKLLYQVPIRYSFAEHRITGITGEREQVKKFVQGMLIQFAALHSYDDLKIGMIYDEKESEWDCVKWMPHAWSNDRMIKFMAKNAEEVNALSRQLELVSSMRAEMSAEDLQYEKPHYVIIIAAQHLGEKSEFIKNLYKERKSANISLILLYDEQRLLPKTCKHVLEVTEKGVEIFDYTDADHTEMTSDNSMFYHGNIEEIFRSLSNVKLDVVAGKASMPENLTLFEMLDIGKPQHMDFMNLWKKSNPTKTLAVPIGVDSEGNFIYLDIHEKAHGPHGLIAGSTGSGKSEFIISLITMLSLYYSPEEVGFILIDFKGGGMADVFRKLPHLSGTITNLDGNELNRSLIAIEAELEKRQQLFKETSNEQKISNLDIYRYQQLYREGKVKEALPHLIIIADEFAELKQQHDEFLEQLIRTARIGRSLGVHLILATQKPDGVVGDQIKSNLKFKVCLRVQDKEDSVSMLDRPEAAAIRVPGRFYLKVGMNELFELGQSPFSGAAYEEAENTVKYVDDSLIVFDGSERIAAKCSGVKNNLTEKKQIDVLLTHMSEVCQQNGLKGSLLWREQLPGPKRRSEKTYSDEQRPFVLNPVVGQYDDLRRRSYYPLTVPLSSEGNALVYGVAGSGTLEFCNTMIYSLIKQHSPEELQMYLLDYEAGALRAFEKAPQVEAVYQGYQEKEIELLLDDLEFQLDGRKKLFARYGGNYQNYIANSGNTVPNLVVVLLNAAAAFETEEGYEFMQKIIRLSREGISYGLYFVITGSDDRSIRAQLAANFRQVFVLQQNKEETYRDILGKTDGMIPADYLGRGLFKRGASCYEFQTNILFEEEGEPFAKIEAFCMEMSEKYNGRKTVEDVQSDSVIETLDFTKEWEECKCSAVPVGISGEGKKVCFNLTSSIKHFLIYENESEKKNAEQIIENIKSICDDVEIWDTPEELLDTGSEGIEVYNKKVTALFETLMERGNIGVEALQSGNPIPDFPSKVIVIKSYESWAHCLSNEAYYDLRSIFAQISLPYHIYFVFLNSHQEMQNGISRTLSEYPIESGIYFGRIENAADYLKTAETFAGDVGVQSVHYAQKELCCRIKHIERSETNG